MGFNQDVRSSYNVMAANLANAQMAVENARRRAAVQRDRDLQESHSQDSQIFGKFVVNGVGETRKQVIFPVAFTKAPLVLTTVEVQPDERILIETDIPGPGRQAYNTWTEEQRKLVKPATGLTPGQAPLVQSNIVGWITENHPPVDSYYTGVEILTICEGTRGVKFIVHWSAAGVAYMNPTAGSMSADFRTKMELGQMYGTGMP